MATENRSANGDSGRPSEHQDFAVLRGCLVGGDAEHLRRERQIRRRALVISTLLQAAVLLAVIAVPFFGKSERIALANVTPMPPYYQRGGAPEHLVTQARPAGARPTFCFLCPPARPVTPATLGRNSAATPQELDGGDPIGVGPGSECSGCVPIGNNRAPEKPPPDETTIKMVHVTHLDPAMLQTRVEPIYPALPKQMRREGRVELRAIISTEGRIESLEAVGGDALFYQSAMAAVRQWRYKATMLNGRAVEVETYITVIYTLEK